MTKFKMDSKKKTKWLKALRSGKYKQGKFQLWNGEVGNSAGYCCLGVARAVKLCKGNAGWYDEGVVLPTKCSYGTATHVSHKFLPKKIQDTLSHWNDYGGWSFKRIADWIEKNL